MTTNITLKKASSSQDGCKTSISSNKRQSNRKFLRRKSSGGFENFNENLVSKVGSVSTSILSSSTRLKQIRGTAESDTFPYNIKRRGSLPVEAFTIGFGELKVFQIVTILGLNNFNSD